MMIEYGDLPFCDVCGYPHKDGLPTCLCPPGYDCESRLNLDLEEQDDKAVLKHITT